MRVIDQSHEILSLPQNLLEMVELSGRTCYKSEDRITPGSAEKFVKMLVDRGHHAMIEFGSIIVKLVTNRGVTHELVRHRHCSFAQESTRYVRYDGEIGFVAPVWVTHTLPYTNADRIWYRSMRYAETFYKELLSEGWRPEQAREVLPNSLKTEIVVKANIREWRHILKLRTSKKAHPQMVALMKPLLAELQAKIPVVFDDIGRKN